MNAVLTCLTEAHDWRLTLAAGAICLLSLATAFGLLERARGVAHRKRIPYFIMAPLVGAAGVWATHFLAMIAFRPGVEFGFSAVETIGSQLVILITAYLVMLVALSARGAIWRLLNGVVGGAGVAAMHFLGMAAIRAQDAAIVWSPSLVIAAVAGGAAFGILAALLNRRGGLRRAILASFVATLGVLWLHFTAMGAVSFSPAPGLTEDMGSASRSLIAYMVASVVGGLFMIAAFLAGMIWWSRSSALGQIREAIEAMPDGLGFYDADDRLAVWNRRYAEVNPEAAASLAVGVSFQEILHIGVSRGLYKEAIGREEAWIAERMANRRQPQMAMEQRMADGRWLRVQDRRTVAGGRVTVCSDITDLKRNAVALEEAKDAAEAANRAKSQFLANMSHEIRTPLNGVIGVAQALATTDLTEQQREMLELIQSSSRTLQTLLSDILDLARVESGRLELKAEAFDLARAVDEAAQLYSATAAEKGLQFFVEIAPEAAIWIEGDVVRLKQILTNLVSNAVKFTSSGFVSLTVDVGPSGKGPTLRFMVQDTGIGFDGQVRERLFGRFEQADGEITRRFGGSGLGLAICRELASMMGGDLDCESEPGGGSTFILTVPLHRCEPRANAPEEAGPAPDLHRGETLRILVADDHPTNRRVVELILARAPVSLTSVENGIEALEACRSSDFDLILMDMQMPVMDGLTATREIRLHEAVMGLAPTPIVMLSANALPEHIKAAGEAGADRHLAKPFNAADLLDLVMELPARARTEQAA